MAFRYRKKHLDWMDTVSQWNCQGGLDILSLPYEPFHIHHLYGKTAKHNKILIGPWAILGIPIRLHCPNSNDYLNVTHYPKRFEAEFGTQKDLWLTMVRDMRDKGIKLPFGQDVIEAIEGYHL